MATEFKKLKEVLPYQYGKLISARLKQKGISAEQVRLVFNEEITNAEIVVPVLEMAMVIHEEQKKIKALKKKAKAVA